MNTTEFPKTVPIRFAQIDEPELIFDEGDAAAGMLILGIAAGITLLVSWGVLHFFGVL